ncbi:aKG-HExxH-type peptide beta-hydroxylase [Streptomyces sp. NPDC048172]|uniref:aKG-HExxH-type peptide beta-hydroxylase n=1 Tax=Streptomyces sp. NPDC048172 TaxID=3365505 RepID=UPI003723BA49
MSDRLRCLAMPGSGFDTALMDAVVAAHAEGVAAAFLLRHGRTLGTALSTALAPPWHVEHASDALWDPAVGAVERLLETGEGDPVAAAEGLARCLRRAGGPPEPAPERGPDPGPGPFGAAESVPVNGSSLRLLPERAVRAQLAIEDDFHSIVTFPEPTKELARFYADAVDLLRTRAPRYARWVLRVLRSLVPCDSGASRTRSSSWREAPGTVLVSVSPDPAEVAEMLVHEACHQYFYLARRLGDVTDPADTRQYHSPAVGRSRPLDKVLLAFHAFGNVRLLHEELGTPGVLDRMRRDTETLAAPLRGNPSVTPLGHALVDPLLERLS